MINSISPQTFYKVINTLVAATQCALDNRVTTAASSIFSKIRFPSVGSVAVAACMKGCAMIPYAPAKIACIAACQALWIVPG